MGLDLTGLGSVADFAGSLVTRFFPPKMTGAEKAQAQYQLQEMLEKREHTIIEAQKSIIVSEMQQGDNYTKRARPSVVYMGLLFIGLVHVVFPISIKLIMTFKAASLTPEQLTHLTSLLGLSLPGEFWAAWGSVVSIWSLGRSMERRGAANKLVGMITGR